MTRLAILCVDDEKSILDCLQIELEAVLGDQYLIALAQSGQEALEVILELVEDSYQIALVIVDYIMPGLRGDELLIRIHQISPKTVKIMLTGQADITAVGNAINKANLYRYLTKPWQSEDLILTVKEGIFRYCQEEQLEAINHQQATLIAELHESENQLKQFLEAVPIGIFITDAQGKPYYVNHRGQQIAGQGAVSEISLDELLQTYQAYIANSNQLYPLKKTPIWKALQGESITVDDMELRHSNRSIPIEVSGTPIYDREGKIIYGIVAFQDISERKQAQKVLSDYNSILEAQIAERTTALEHQSASDSLLSSISRTFLNQETTTALHSTLQAIAQFLQAERGCFFEYSDDRSQYHLVDEWVADGISPLANDVRWNTTAMLPWSSQQLLNGEVLIFHSTEQLPSEAIAEKQLFESQSIQSVVAVPIILYTQVVGFISVDVVKVCKRWTAEEIHLLRRVGELVAIARSRHKAEVALREAKEAAEAASRAKSAFLANMSHELRTPLNAILGFAQLMERETNLTLRQQEFLATINRSGEHLLNLINDVLEMSKIEAGRTVVHPVAFDLPRLLQTLQEMFQIRAQAKQLRLEFQIPTDLPRCIITDEGKLRQVLINLLSNAVKFTQQGGILLQVAWEQLSSKQLKLFFEVEDTGQGISPQEIKHLFQPFFQTSSGIQAKEGTGLGLAISRQFVQLMGGNIYITSTLGQGANFRFDINAKLADPSMVMIPATRRVLQLAPDQPRYRILIVDDQQENCNLIAQLLDSAGFATRTACNGEAAIATWQTWQPALIWMDMRMPILDGYTATRRIRSLETRSHTIIIALTASTFAEQQNQCLAAGCDDFVGKPYKEQDIFDKIGQHLGVRYLYAESNPQILANSPLPNRQLKGDSLTPYDLKIMPKQWLDELRQAATRVNAKLLTQLIQQIPREHQNLADALNELTRQFRFDLIVELTESQNERS